MQKEVTGMPAKDVISAASFSVFSSSNANAVANQKIGTNILVASNSLGIAPSAVSIAPTAVGIQSQQFKKIKFKDTEKIQKLCTDVLSVRTSLSDPTNRNNTYKTHENASKILNSYARELSCAILEEAALLAKHRKSTEVTDYDINLVLVKKFQIELPDLPKITTHSQILKATPISRQPLCLNPQPPSGISIMSSVSSAASGPTALQSRQSTIQSGSSKSSDTKVLKQSKKRNSAQISQSQTSDKTAGK